MTETQVRLFASPQSWMEGEAVRQLYATAKLEGVRLVVGFPDLHPGKGTPVGAAIVTDGAIYPHLIGGDIGCGMALFKTDLVRRGAPLDRWAEKFFHLEHPWDEDIGSFLAEHDLEFTEFDAALGTIGGGNHFAELQAVEEILQAGEFRKLGLDQQQLVVLVHSGSRGLGESVLRAHTDQHFGEGVEADSFAAEEYLRGHDLAVRWARANRELIVRRFAVALGAETERLWDGCHNSITPSPRSSLRKENQNLAKGRREARERAGKDGFHSVPNGLKKEWDGVESVLTTALLASRQQMSAVALTLPMNGFVRALRVAAYGCLKKQPKVPRPREFIGFMPPLFGALTLLTSALTGSKKSCRPTPKRHTDGHEAGASD